MNKNKIINFVSKYHLNGLCDKVKIVSKQSKLLTNFSTEQFDLVGYVLIENVELPDNKFGIFNTSLLLKVLNALEGDISVDITEKSLVLSDGSMTSNIMLADMSIIDDPPGLEELPETEIELTLNTDFINKFIKAKGAIVEANQMAFIQKKNKLQLVLNYADHNSDTITFDLSTDKMSEIPIMRFNADNFKEVLMANRDCTTASLSLRSGGMMEMNFKNPGEFMTKYYMIMLQSA